MKASVVVPTYGRPESLRACLEGLGAQTRSPDQVVVGVHAEDEPSRRVVRELRGDLPLEEAPTEGRRVVPLMEAGVRRASGEVVALTDDDAVPRPEWLGCLLEHYGLPGVGGAGGRDLLDDPDEPPGRLSRDVGTVTWFGRHHSDHHLGEGSPREVDVLRGVSFSLRRELFRFDHRLLGSGMQMHWELDLCLGARRAGWRLVYDPAAVVEHRRVPRVQEASRSGLEPDAVRDEVHNELYALLKWLPWWRKLVAVGYGFAVGKRIAPGAALTLERLLREPDRGAVVRRSAAAFSGRARAVRTFAEHLRQ